MCILQDPLTTRSGVVAPGPDRTEIYRRGRKIILSIDGRHTNEAARQTTGYLVALVNEIKGPIEFVADLRKITGFSAESRSCWQETFKQVQARINLITVVQGTALAKMSAAAIGLYAGIKVRYVDTLEQALQITTV